MWEKFENKSNRIIILTICAIIFFKIFIYDPHISELGRFKKTFKLVSEMEYTEIDSKKIEVKAVKNGIEKEFPVDDYFDTKNISLYNSNGRKIANAKLSRRKYENEIIYVVRKWGHEFIIEKVE